MSLHLDARQRAMLLEMGVRVWQAPEPQASPIATLPAASAALAGAMPAITRPPGATPVAPPRVQPRAVAPVPAPARTEAAGAAHTRWSLLPSRLLYPHANPAHTPAGLGAGWLVVTEAVAADDPQAEGATRLLHAMLQALQLHLHPRVALCALQSAAQDGAAQDSAARDSAARDSAAQNAPAHEAAPADIRADIAAQVAAFSPSVVLLMGRSAVRAALGSGEPLARLRAQDLRIAGVSAVATYDALLLLRNPQGKRAAWADLCRARALAGVAAS